MCHSLVHPTAPRDRIARAPYNSTMKRSWLPLAALLLAAACGGGRAPAAQAPAERASVLLITLDTTRADAIGPEAEGVQTPAFNALAARGLRFRQAYATVPETLPSHTSMLSGLYPGGHGVHENARHVPASTPLVADDLHRAGYRTAAFVSSFVLDPQFGLDRGFDRYDAALPADSKEERASPATADAAIAELSSGGSAPRFVWVHFYDPHAPYAPPEPFRTTYREHPYLGEIAAMDAQIGRLVAAFDRLPGPRAIIVAGDHGEGLGEHGEQQHGRLLYQATMHVPLVVVGPGVAPGTSDVPVSTRRVFHTIRDFAGLGSDHSLRASSAAAEPVLGEAMKPFLEYGWLPQVMLVTDHYKAILAGTMETYDLAADRHENRNLGSSVSLDPQMRSALEQYPVPSPDAAPTPAALDEDAKRRLAALGYVGATSAPVVRTDAPRPADMTAIFPLLDLASGLFTAGRYGDVIPVLQKILAADPNNLDAQLRLATSYSSLRRNDLAEQAFARAAAIAPGSDDVRTYLALHYARAGDAARARPLLEQVVQAHPDRRAAVEALGALESQAGLDAMSRGDTPAALAAFERARHLLGGAFRHDLELGVLYLDARRFAEARDALDRALARAPDDAMTLFKRAQVSVLLREPDAAARIAQAREKADATTRPLIERERLFK
jgi:arylsulfatase A-like enzyme/Tfp pilus assembly protein PilF